MTDNPRSPTDHLSPGRNRECGMSRCSLPPSPEFPSLVLYGTPGSSPAHFSSVRAECQVTGLVLSRGWQGTRQLQTLSRHVAHWPTKNLSRGMENSDKSACVPSTPVTSPHQGWVLGPQGRGPLSQATLPLRAQDGPEKSSLRKPKGEPR